MSFVPSGGGGGSGSTSPPDVNMSSPAAAAAAAATTTTSTSPTTITTTPTTTSRRNSGSPRDEVDAAISSQYQHQRRSSSNNSNKNNNNNSSPKGPGSRGSAESTSDVRYGKCKWFNVAKGWGFITPNDGGQEVFVHQSVIQMSGFRSLGEQEDVEFECKTTPRGLEATRVSGREGTDCNGSTFRPRTKKRFRRVRCYNCGEFANHIASKCELGPQPKRCHLCKQEDHLFADCPMKKAQTSANTSGGSGNSQGDLNLSSP